MHHLNKLKCHWLDVEQKLEHFFLYVQFMVKYKAKINIAVKYHLPWVLNDSGLWEPRGSRGINVQKFVFKTNGLLNF